jgi:guanylate kinase
MVIFFNRGTEKEESIQTRLHNARVEIDFSKTPGFFDIVLVNDNLDKTYNALKDFIFNGVKS